MTRRLLAALLLLSLATVAMTTEAIARTRAVTSAHPEQVRGAGTVSGIVTSVSGNLIHLAGGLVTIDATGAKILVERGREGTVAEIEPGMLLFAALKSTAAAENAPLAAAVITATRFAETTLFGAVQTVDAASSSFTLFGRTIHIDSETSLGGFDSAGELLPNHIVQVEAENRGGRLVATSVLLISRIPPAVSTARGTVKSISSDSWVIAREKESDLTLVVNAQTKILGSPKVGDTVEVLYAIDASHANVAISIVKFERPQIPPPNQTTFFHGKVKAIEPAAWTLTLSAGNDVRVLINERTKILPGIAVGDGVEVVALKNSNGELVALVIVKLPR